MTNYILQIFTKLTFFTTLLVFLNGCNASTASHLKSYKQTIMLTPSGEEISVYIADSEGQQRKGLSEIAASDFSKHEAMLFPETRMFPRQFWMPNTHFDLDVIFMNGDYYVLEIHRGLKSYPHPANRMKTPFSKKVFSQHVLELRADSPLAKKIMPGMSLRFKSFN